QSALALSGCTQYSPLYRIKHERWRGGMDPAEGHEGGGGDPPRRIHRDRTAVSRIRDAALSEFAAHGVARATMRSVAEAAGVSAQLVVHHFGSKEGLAAACDEHVLQLFREHNVSLLGSGSAFAPVESLEATWLGPAMATWPHDWSTIPRRSRSWSTRPSRTRSAISRRARRAAWSSPRSSRGSAPPSCCCGTWARSCFTATRSA